MKIKPDNLESKLKITFNNHDLLKEATTHRSFINENPSWPTSHNERLEFLGDAVLELIVTRHLYDKYPNEPEGRLTSIRSALVNHVMLSRVAREIGLDGHIRMSRGELKDVGKAREVILANAIEAVIGAIYLDTGYEATKTFVEECVMSHLNEVMSAELYRDPKSLLQEVAQETKRITPVYKVLEEHGPDHQKKFIVGVYFDDEEVAQGKGTSKQEAEREAAGNALNKISSIT